jgi:peptidoglycan/xylan/chitin deacetylase (PgdA/CDA1 family)
MVKFLLKRALNALLPLADTLSLGSFTRGAYAGNGHILMLHRVLPGSGLPRIHNHLTLEITPLQLEETILYFKRKGYVFLSLDELYYNLVNNLTVKNFCVFTFDDGYRDNLNYALPVLKKYNVPFTVYVTTDFCDSRAFIWWYMLEDFVRRENKIRIEFGSNKYNLRTDTTLRKENAFERIRQGILRLENNDEIEKVFNTYGLQKQNYIDSYALTWDEVVQLSQSGIATIGSHTVSHPNLMRLSETELKFQLSESKKRIEAATGVAAGHFCYPAGRYGAREETMVRQSGYITSTTCVISNIFDHHQNKLMQLPRIPINHYVSEKYLNLVTTGLLPVISNKLLRRQSE